MSLPNSYLIRPVKHEDLDSLYDLVLHAKGGLSSLQPNRDYLSGYINDAVDSFEGLKSHETPHKYLMGMFEVGNAQMVGCAAVKTCIGQEHPFINFDLIGDGLDQYLQASSRFLGATEVGSLFVHPDYRALRLGKFLAQSRYLLIGSEPSKFGDTIIAELRGVCGQEGSPLYDYLFKDKLEQTFLEADSEYYDRNPHALGDIVPIGRVPTATMPRDVRASIAQPHPSGMAARRLLQNEGFIFSGTIDLFDAGPIFCAYTDTLRTIINMQTFKIDVKNPTGDDTQNDDGEWKPYLISAGSVNRFRAIVTNGTCDVDTIFISDHAMKALGCEPRERVYMSVSP